MVTTLICIFSICYSLMSLSIPGTVACAIIFLISVSFSAFGQSEIVSNQDSAFAKQKDIVDLLQGGFKTHLRKDTLSTKGSGPFFSILPVMGYSLQSGLTGAIVTNTSFYTDASKSRFSNLLINGYYSQYHQYWFTANSTLFFEKYKLHLVGDTRYYNFPTQTYGLGTNSMLTDGLDIKYSYFRISQIAFRELTPSIFAGAGYNLDYHWNITNDTIAGKALSDFNMLQKGTTHSVSSGISLNILFDNRKNPVNPERGSYANIQYRPNLKMLGSDTNWQSLLIDLRTYVKFPASSHNVLAFWNYYNFTLAGTPPYLDTPSTGWDAYSNTGRGYVPGWYTGKNFNYLESEYRFCLTRNGILGAVVFGNIESVYQTWKDALPVIPGGGFGLRIKMNKYSNTNVAIDYGFGVGGSHGFFFNLGEVF